MTLPGPNEPSFSGSGMSRGRDTLPMLIAEDLLLLLTDDTSGKVIVDYGRGLDNALAGAILLDLKLAGAVDIAKPHESGKPRYPHVVIREAGPLADEILNEALRRLERKEGKKPHSSSGAMLTLTKGLKKLLYKGLAERGIVHGRRAKVPGINPRTFGIVSRQRWPAADSERERRVRVQLRDHLVYGITTDERTGAIIGLLSAMNTLTRVINPRDAGVTKRELSQRGKALAEGQWAREGLREAVKDVNQAVRNFNSGG